MKRRTSTEAKPPLLVLDDPVTWPKHVKDRLGEEDVVEVLREHEFIEELVKHPVLQPVLEEIEAYVAQTPLAAYHCTKQLAEHPFAVNGLRVLNFDEHHAHVLGLIRGHELFPPKVFQRFEKLLKDWRKHNGANREKMLWVCVDRCLVLDPGAESFFKYFGGEAIYFSVMDDPELGPLFEQLGEPVVVEVRINSRDLKVFQHPAFARTLVSHFAKSVNPEFFVENREGYLSKGVSAKDVVAVHPHREFVKRFGRKRKKK